MRIAVLGAGGLGGYFGARLCEGGSEVHFIARGQHLDALRADGLRIEGPSPLHIRPVSATDDARTIGVVDLVMVCVKLWDTEAALDQIRPLVGPGTTLVSFQNGVLKDSALRSRYADAQIMGGVGYVATTIDRPGVIRQTGPMQRLIFGEFDGSASDRGKAFLVSGAASADLTGKACSPNTIHWAYDTWMLANGTGAAIVATGGGTWFFLSADYAFGHALERDTEAVVTKAGGKVLGKVRHPLNTQDFSSFLLQAQASKAKIVGLANAGGDTGNAIKQAAEFGIVAGGQQLAALLFSITDVHALGLKSAQGLIATDAFYWDLNEATRAFAKRFAAKNRGIHPTMIHAGVYASVLHYLKAVEALGSDDGTRVIAKMKDMPTDDPLFGKGTIRADGRKIHPAYLVEVKKPEESKGPWDYYRIRATIPADRAFRPLADGGCPLIR